MKAIIIEDEAIIANVLKNKIQKLDDSIDILDILTSKEEALYWLKNNEQPDVLFMDIQLSDGVSFDIFDEHDITSPVIFTTAYDEYAIRAFKVNGIDYLLKPIQDDELEKALFKLKSMVEKKESLPDSVLHFIQNLTSGQTSLGTKYKEIFLVDFRNQKLPVQVTDIAFIHKEAINSLYLFSGEKYYLDTITLDELETQLDPQKFFRVNRQTIIQLNAIHSIKSQENATIDLTLKKPHDKMEITVSRSRCPDFRKWMNR